MLLGLSGMLLILVLFIIGFVLVLQFQLVVSIDQGVLKILYLNMDNFLIIVIFGVVDKDVVVIVLDYLNLKKDGVGFYVVYLVQLGGVIFEIEVLGLG